ncbi:MAG: ParB/RepB/Spo0J family partition protein [Desulfuromonadaceae bacterium]|nr:ParB/RepB/Spo0J family partition protein [Desulfuromonadaceae bacterium]
MNIATNKNDHLSGVIYLPTIKLDQNPQQPRLRTNDTKLEALSENIRIYGVLEPILVCRRDDNYSLIAGHRRLAAAIKVGLEEIPARILSSEFNDYLAAAVSENMLREDLNPLEVAIALNDLADGGANRKALCAISGLSSPSVSELLHLKVIPIDVSRECISNNDTSKRFLIQLSHFKAENEIRAAYQYFLEHKQLPSRQKRSYIASKEIMNPLELLTMLNKSLTESTDIYYTAGNISDEKFRLGIVSLLENLKNHGWFIPKKFDVSNPDRA